MKQSLRLIDAAEPTREEIAMAEIDQEHREAKWTPFSEPQKSPTFDPDAVLRRSAYIVITNSKVGRARRLWRWVVETVRAIPR